MSATVVRDTATPWVASWLEECRNSDPAVDLLGIPFDQAVSYRPGCRHAPAAIRAAFSRLSTFWIDRRRSFETLSLHDHGDVDVSHDFAVTYCRIADVIAAIPESGTTIILGGDHSIADPVVRGLARRRGATDFGLIIFDAHLDCREPIAGQEHSGNWLWTLQKEYSLHRTVHIGANAPIYGPGHLLWAEQAGVLVLTAHEARRRGWPEAIQEALARACPDGGGVHVSVDIDCVDSAFAPGTSVPNALGITPHDLADSLFEIGRSVETASLDLVEVSPPLDPSGRTTELAAALLCAFLAGRAERIEKRNLS